MSLSFFKDPYGKNTEELKKVFPEEIWLHGEILPDLEKLRDAAAEAGFLLRIESGFRSFERQLSIWNRKAEGELPLLNERGTLFEEAPFNEKELMYRILLWSALPGASRHHFGTEIDVSDAKAIPKNYEVQLTTAECDGMFAPFHAWLSERIETGKSFGFTRVFVPGRGKIQPEKWHLSHLPTARKIQERFSESALKEIFERSEISCKEAILSEFPVLLQNYVYPYFI